MLLIAVAFLGLAPMLGMGLIFGLPLLALVGLGIGPAVAAAFDEPRCAECHLVADRTRAAAPAEARAPSVVASCGLRR